VAHEINNPLAIIDTIAGLISETITEEKEKLHPATQDIMVKAVERLGVQVKRCMNITDSLLGFVRKSKAGKQEVDIPELLEEPLNLLASEINNAGVEIHRHYSPDLPRPMTDPMLLEQVFVNLIKNAIEAIEEKSEPPGIIELSAITKGDRVEISIRDNGVGIPVETRNQIFDLFHTSKPVGKGTGLGLAIVHDLLKRLGCEIRVASEEGQWSCFTVLVPVSPPA
jgi:two-component system NtrC family sensor kinase